MWRVTFFLQHASKYILLRTHKRQEIVRAQFCESVLKCDNSHFSGTPAIISGITWIMNKKLWGHNFVKLSWNVTTHIFSLGSTPPPLSLSFPRVLPHGRLHVRQDTRCLHATRHVRWPAASQDHDPRVLPHGRLHVREDPRCLHATRQVRWPAASYSRTPNPMTPFTHLLSLPQTGISPPPLPTGRLPVQWPDTRQHGGQVSWPATWRRSSRCLHALRQVRRPAASHDRDPSVPSPRGPAPHDSAPRQNPCCPIPTPPPTSSISLPQTGTYPPPLSTGRLPAQRPDTRQHGGQVSWPAAWRGRLAAAYRVGPALERRHPLTERGPRDRDSVATISETARTWPKKQHTQPSHALRQTGAARYDP